MANGAVADTSAVKQVTEEALETGMQSAERSLAASRIDRTDSFTPTVMALIEQAITDGRISLLSILF